jgi:spore germination protein GerM
MTRRTSAALAVLASLGLLLLAAGCGIPTESTARPIDRDAMPKALVEQASTTTVASSPGSRNRTAELFLVSSRDASELLEPVKVDIVNVVDPAEYPRQVIEQLIAQPTQEGEGGLALTNAIPASSRVLNATLDDGVLDLDLSDLGEVELSRQRLAAAQIVYTATAINGIDGVRFSIDGEPAAVLLDEHASDVGQVIRRGDYPSLLDS